MNGVNLIDLIMPSPTPSPAGTRTTMVGGMKLVLPRKAEGIGEEKVESESGVERKVNWKLILMLLLGVIIVIKLATWYARRYGK